jgi:hypothetical protein
MKNKLASPTAAPNLLGQALKGDALLFPLADNVHHVGQALTKAI